MNWKRKTSLSLCPSGEGSSFQWTPVLNGVGQIPSKQFRVFCFWITSRSLILLGICSFKKKFQDNLFCVDIKLNFLLLFSIVATLGQKNAISPLSTAAEKKNIGDTNRTSQEIWCLVYAGFLYFFFCFPMLYKKKKKKKCFPADPLHLWMSCSGYPPPWVLKWWRL